MKKAYDVNGLIEELKGHGLDLAEDAALKVFDATKAWIVKSAAMSENPYDDIAPLVISAIDKQVKDLIDQIDGEKG